MKIDYLKINGFGKIKNKEIELKDGMNIIYGENEAGKSTIMKFITAMLFGVSKNKNGKNISDFEKYGPWDNSSFSGKMKYTLDNQQTYEVFREFKKKSPIIYNALGEDISKRFSATKQKEITFFEQQVGIGQDMFCKTSLIGQQEVKLEKSDTNNMLQKISNLVSTGDDNISFKKSMEKINKMQNDKIGTERTKNKPINIANENIKKLLENKKSLMKDKEAQNHLQDRKKITEELEKLQSKKELLKNKQQMMNDTKIKSIEKKFKMKNYIFILLFLVVLVVLLAISRNKLLALIPALFIIADIFMMLKTNSKAEEKDSDLEITKISQEIESVETKIDDLKFKNRMLENEKTNMDEKLEELTKVEEALEEQESIKNELMSLNVAFELAKECLENAYQEIKQNISPRFEQKLCEIIEQITDGEYKKATVNDEVGLNIEIQNGNYMSVDRLSIGTIDEMYLALRLSMLEEISDEKLPIILDEAFAYFDEERLKNVLCYLQDKNYENQIIIFTCSNREKEALNELKIEYNLINLEK